MVERPYEPESHAASIDDLVAEYLDLLNSGQRVDPFAIISTAAVDVIPRGAVLSHGNVIASNLQSLAAMGLDQDDGNLLALRFRDWKVVFAEQRSHGFDVWQDPFVQLRFPKLFNLRTDPFERADHEAIGYGQWRADRMFALVPAQSVVAEFLATFQEFPPRQKPSSFSIDQVLEKLQEGGRGSN